MTLGAIWAQSIDGIIGDGVGMPWHLPEDLKHFRQQTMGHVVLLGRKTWESLPSSVRPLPGRPNIVLTRDALFEPDGALAVGCADAALAASDEAPWVIGGGEIYTATLPLADVLAVTEVDADIVGDTRAPSIPAEFALEEDAAWRESSSGLRYRHLTYRRER